MMKVFIIVLLFIPIVFSACPSGYTLNSNNNLCYKVYSIPKNWYDAEQTCFNENGHLASVDSAFTNLFLGNSIKNQTQAIDFWLGGYWNWFDTRWQWTDFSNFSNAYWASGQPVTASKTQYCSVENVKEYKWYPSNCTFLKPFVCELNINVNNNPCSDGWIYNQVFKRCYKHVTHHSNLTCDVMQIENYCQNIGGHLISIHSYAENLFVASIYRSYYNNNTDPDKYYWTGLVVDSTDYNDWDNPNNFQWTDGTVLDFINWDSYSPHNPCTYLENYILDSTNVYYRWDSGACSYDGFCDPNNDPSFNPTDFICAMSLS